METSLINGELAFRQHSGGYISGPNQPACIVWAAGYFK